jgi:hypothetical protein
MIAVNDLDEVNNILQEWALSNFGEVLDLPEALIKNKDATEIITKNIDSFVYLESPISSYMNVSRYAGISGDLPTFPKELVGGEYVMPATVAFLYSETDFSGYFGEYSISSSNFTLATGVNYIGIDFNGGTPIWQLYSNDSYFNYSSIIPVIAVFSFSGSVYILPIGQTGYGLPEKLIEVQNKRKPFDIITDFTLTTDTNYIELGDLTVNNGVQDIDCLAIDTELVDNDMYLYYRDGSSVWQTTKVTQINNTQYQSSGSGLQSLGAGEFVINNIYRVIDSEKLLLFYTLTDKFANITDALNSELATDLPDEVKKTAVLVGRIIVEKDSTTPTVTKVQKVNFGVA